MNRTRPALLAALVAALATGSAQAQDKPKDDALDRLLEKLEGKAPDPESAPKPKKDAPKDKPADAEKAKPKDKPKAKAADAEPKDKALDSLLEKLGQTKEAPKTTGTAGESPDGPDKDKPAKGADDKAADRLKPGEKPLDEHLEELTGRVKKKKPGQSQQGQSQGQPKPDDGSGDDTPIGRAVKKMREVETKLGDSETGEETRKTQGEIVKDLDNLIAQAKRQAQMQPGQRRRGNRPGPPQPGDPGDQPGTQPNDGRPKPPMKVADPKNTAALVGDKNTWGNLPAYIRDEMENVFRAEPLPAKAERIGRYYKAVAKKGMTSRGG